MKPNSRVRAATVAAGVAALTFAGCGLESGETAPDEIVFAIDSATIGFDPNVTPAAQDARVMRQVYDGLISLDDEGEFIPSLAEEWEVSDDGTVYTFSLRDDVTFQDDTPFNAEAVCFNFDRIKAPETGSRYAVSLIGPYESCEVVDEFTAQLTLGAPYAPFLRVLTSPFLGMVSPTAVETQGAEDFNLRPVGTGPFRLTEYVPMSRIVLERNEDYNWAPPNAEHDGPAHLSKITFQIMPDPTVRLGSLRAHRIEALGNVPETDAERTEADESLNLFVRPQSGSPFQLYFNQSKAPFDDVKVRQAFARSVNVPVIVDALYFGVYEKANGNLSSTTPAYDESLGDLYPYDPEEANRLLDEAGWEMGPDGVRVKDGQELVVDYNEQTPNREKRQDIAQFVKYYAEEVGFKVNVRLMQVPALTASSQGNDYHMYGLSLVQVDPNVLWSILGSPFISDAESAGFNYPRVTHYDDILLEAQAEQDPDVRNEMYVEIQRQLAEDAVSLPLYVPTYTMATRGISGLRFDSEGYPIFYDVVKEG